MVRNKILVAKIVAKNHCKNLTKSEKIIKNIIVIFLNILYIVFFDILYLWDKVALFQKLTKWVLQLIYILYTTRSPRGRKRTVQYHKNKIQANKNSFGARERHTVRFERDSSFVQVELPLYWQLHSNGWSSRQKYGIFEIDNDFSPNSRRGSSCSRDTQTVFLSKWL